MRRRLRLSRFERVIAAALVVSAAVPLAAGVWLAGRLAEENLALGLNPRVVERLRETPALYGELFQATKALHLERARAIAARLPAGDPAAPGRPGGGALAEALEEAVRSTPALRRVAIVAADGATIAEAEAREPAAGEFRAATARVPVAGGRTLECTFAVEARWFAELDDARELAERYESAAKLRPHIHRSYVRAFGAILLAWALLAGLAGAILARRTTRRVAALVDATRRLARGDLAVQVEAGRGDDELSTLARSFNAMVREVRESRDRIVYLEKISGWQEVARRLAHEIKNPLTPIQLAFQHLETRLAPRAAEDPELAKVLGDAGEIVREEIGTLQRLVEEFSGFAKLPDVKPEPEDLGDFVDDFLRTSPQVAEEADVHVVKSQGPFPVRIDRAMLRRVLANLVRNAIEASRPDRAKLHVGVLRTRELVALTIADEGPGIPPEVRARIFDPYFTTKKEGTGLGLAIAKKIVLQHEGGLEAGARPGGGAQFTLTFPLDVPVLERA
jgi:nitrogen fixation/metabolism regulation signal transduction histidine kinase